MVRPLNPERPEHFTWNTPTMNNTRAFLLGLLVAGIAAAGSIPFLQRTTANDAPRATSPRKAKTPARPKRRAKPRVARQGPVRVAGVMVNAPVHFGPVPKKKFGMENLAFFGTFARTRIALNLRLPADDKRRIISLDHNGSTVKSWRDDRGQQFLGGDRFGGGPYEMMPRVSKDGRDLVCHLQSKKLPKPGAQAMNVTGELKLLVSTGQATTTSDPVEIKQGASFTCGGYTLDVKSIETKRGKPTITFVTKQDPAAITSWALTDADENAIPLSRRMSMSGGTSWTLSFEADKPLPPLGALRLNAWTAPETLKIPYTVRATLSLH